MMLLAAVVALFAGVAVVPALRGRPRALATLDGFVLTALAGLVAVHLVPESLAVAGWPAAALVVVGLWLPRLLEGHPHGHDGHTEPWSVVGLAAVGLGVHGFLDGGALAAETVDPHHGRTLALGVVLHRLPMGAVLGLLGLARGRPAVAWATATLVAASTGVGFLAGLEALPRVGLTGLALLQALVAGTLAHVVLSREPGLGDDSAGGRVAAAGGAVAGLAVTVGLLLSHGDSGGHDIAQRAARAFVGLGLDTAPALLVAFVGAGLLTALLRDGPLTWVGRGPIALQALKGVAVGLPVPVCSCGVLPVYEGLVRRGVPAAAALAFLIATPELGVDAVLISIPLLGPELTIARVLAAFGVAWVAGAVLGTWLRRPSPVAAPPPAAALPLGERLREGMVWAFTELADHLLPWMLVGLLLAAIAEPVLADGALAALPRWLQVPAAAIAGLPIYVCASGSTPIAAVLLSKGLSPGAALAFLLAGPATNLTTFGVVRRTWGTGAALGFGVAVGGGAIVAGWLTDLALGDVAVAGPVHAGAEAHGAVAWVALAGLGLIALSSLLRQGPRGWVDQVAGGAGGGGHEHEGGPGHGHDGGHGHGHGHGHGVDEPPGR